ncbi:MAG: HlyD family secretion protein [Betaproteobacteria bacterium]|nr:HlyD family secretion protein [Betaproteobacteria bacterium]MDH3437072.1 HlyD family secretion protein [Betaproteobacteria bacterium]
MATNESDSNHAHRESARANARFSGGGKVLLVGVAVLLLAVSVAHWMYNRWTHVYLDDARIDGEVMTVSSRVSGWVTELPVIEGDRVKKGQLLARVDERDSILQREVLVAKLRAIENQMEAVKAQTGQVDEETLGKYQSETNRLAAAEAEVASLAVQLKQARYDYERAEELAKAKWVSPQALERARSAYHQVQESHRKAQAEVAAVRGTLAAAGGSRRQLKVMGHQLSVLAHQAEEIRAEIRRRDIDIADRTIVSPAEGRVVMTFVRQGEHVSPGQRILMFHDPDEIWVEANVKETEVRLLKPGMKAEVRVDAYPGKVYEGEVFRVGRTATSKFALLPDPNPSGNFTKITQRLPVRISLAKKDLALRPGMMVEVSIAIRNN